MARLSLFDMYETLIYPRLEEIEHFRTIGYREKDLAAMCGVSESSWKKIKKAEYADELKIALTNSKARLLMSIEKTLFQKALAGDKTCIIFSLKNLAPERWRDVHQVESTTDVRVVNDLAGGTLDIGKGTKAVKRLPSEDSGEYDANDAFDVKMLN